MTLQQFYPKTNPNYLNFPFNRTPETYTPSNSHDYKDVPVSLILPAYNEAKALPAVLTSVFSTLDNNYEVIVVDDGSSDETAEVARRFPCHLIRHTHNSGKGAAVRTGLMASHGRVAIVMDADNTYPVEVLPHMAKLLQEYDLVRCSRQASTGTMPLVNRIGNKLFDTVLRVVHGLEGGDYLTGLYGLRREALDLIQFTSNGFDLEVEIGIKARAYHLRSMTFPAEYRERLGEKKLHPLRDGWRILRRTLTMAILYNPILTFIVPGLLLWALTLGLVVAVKGVPFTPSFQTPGFTTLFMLISGLAGGFQLIVFGIAAALYGVKIGLPAKNWLTRMTGRNIRKILAITGSILLLAGSLSLGTNFVNYMTSLHSDNGEHLMSDTILLLAGMQLTLAALFISIFAEKVRQNAAVIATTLEGLN